jgi:TonB-dependent SusC/RagA subfamily outer membrane receptor
MRKVLLFLAIVLVSCTITLAQTKSVLGTVTDKNGNPIEGASVVIQGQTQGTTTDAKGQFRIQAKPTDVLVISAINFAAMNVKVGNQNTIGVSLDNAAAQVEEVVVTALGIRRNRNTLPYATQQVSADELNKVPSTNALANLSGKVAGLTVTNSNGLGGSSNAILRGFKSFTQSNQALFVIDGVPMDNTTQTRQGLDLGTAISDINPDDIDNISVLKGASASALYGARGSNGRCGVVVQNMLY